MRRSNGVAVGQLRGPGRQLNANSGLSESNYSGVMPTTRRRRSARSSLIRLRCLNWPHCRGSLFYVPRRPPAGFEPEPFRRDRRKLPDPSVWAVSGVGTDGSIAPHDGEDVREDFWADPVAAWWARCSACGDLHYLPAPETRVQVAAAVAKGQLFVTWRNALTNV